MTLLDKFISQVAARTDDAGTITKAGLREAFAATTAEDDRPRELHDDDVDGLAEQWAAMSVPEARPHDEPHAPEDAEYELLARATGIADPASLRRD